MAKKILSLLITIFLFASLLTGCMRNDIGIQINQDGTGSISTTIGIEKDFYEQLRSTGADPFEEKMTYEYLYEDKTYVSYTETKEYSTYEDMEAALLEMTYNAEEIEGSVPYKPEISLDEITEGTIFDNITIDTPTVEDTEENDRIFETVSIEKDSGFFNTTYTFNAKTNALSTDSEYEANDIFKVTVTIKLPGNITETTGNIGENGEAIFEITDITESKDISIASNITNTGTITIGIAAIVITIVSAIFFAIKNRE